VNFFNESYDECKNIDSLKKNNTVQINESTGYETRSPKIFFRNWTLIPLAFIQAFLAYDYLAASSDLSDIIEDYKRTGFNSSQLEDLKGRKEIVGYFLIIGTVATLVLSAIPVEIEVSPEKLNFKYQL
jgi:hypothetical protein